MGAIIQKAGAYAKKQLFGPSRILMFSHGARFRMAEWLVRRASPSRLLDYGCGDGTFLQLLDGSVPLRHGFDTDAQQLRECRARIGASVRFLGPDDLAAEGLRGSFDMITCMEVLEHCTPEQRRELLDHVERLVRPGGTVVFSVPIEIGPSLLGKQVLRALLGYWRVGHYQHRETYTFGELLRMLFAGRGTAIERPVYREQRPDGSLHLWHGHKGFNWKELGAELRTRFELRERLFTPFGFSGGLLSSQVWFVCVRRPERP